MSRITRYTVTLMPLATLVLACESPMGPNRSINGALSEQVSAARQGRGYCVSAAQQECWFNPRVKLDLVSVDELGVTVDLIITGEFRFTAVPPPFLRFGADFTKRGSFIFGIGFDALVATLVPSEPNVWHRFRASTGPVPLAGLARTDVSGLRETITVGITNFDGSLRIACTVREDGFFPACFEP